jgi:di/tripeptidase
VAVLPTVIGQRPAGKIDHNHPLVQSASDALTQVGVNGRHLAASTDANAGYPLGIPAIAIGIAYGGNEHTTKEWIEIESVEAGLEALSLTIVYSLESLNT